MEERTGPEERTSSKVTEGGAWSTGGVNKGALVEGRPRRRRRSGLENFIVVHVLRGDIIALERLDVRLKLA